MSIASYRKNLAKGATGHTMPTCFPSAIEQLSPYYGYKPGVYYDYVDFVNWYSKYPLSERDYLVEEYEEAVERLVSPLGGLSLKDVQFSRATTVTGFLRIVRPLLRNNYGVVIDITKNHGVTHSVGLLPVGQEDDHVTLVSTHVPKYLQGIVDLRLLGESLAVSEYTYVKDDHPLNNANITAFPIAS